MMTIEQLAQDMNISTDVAELLFGDGTEEVIARRKQTLEGLIKAGRYDLPPVPKTQVQLTASNIAESIRNKRKAHGML
ncbi:MAG: hypothetical protein EOM37_14195 [Proteobacteria bacterium]|nr:hypothetical protein [Pseudomonadota bacterium]